MEKRAIGDSGIEVAPLALGGNVFDWTADEKASFGVLDAFVEAGGTMIDTADVYSAWVPGHKGGESEALIGRWLRRDPAKRDKVAIATKVGFMAGLAPDTLANGFLTGKYRNRGDLDKSPRGLRNIAYLEGKGMRVLEALDEIAAETGAALATISLAWLMAQPGITAALASATSDEQLKQLTAAMHFTLTPQQIARLDAAS